MTPCRGDPGPAGPPCSSPQAEVGVLARAAPDPAAWADPVPGGLVSAARAAGRLRALAPCLPAWAELSSAPGCARALTARRETLTA